MIKKLKRRFIHVMNRPVSDSSELSVSLLVTSAIVTVFVLVFGFIYLIDNFESFAKSLFE